MYILRLANVLVLSFASEIGSASFLEAPGYLSTSSRNKYFIGCEDILDGLFAPDIVKYIPSNCNSSFWLLSSLKRFFNAGLALINGLILLSDIDSPSFSDGYTIIVDDGSCWITYPSIFMRASVPPH